METWRPVLGYEGIYEASNLGDIRSIDRTITRSGRSSFLKSVLLKSWTNKGNYSYVCLYDKGRSEQKKVARIVLEAFIGKCPNEMESCHIDGNVFNNTLSNLRWDTHRNNLADKIKHGTHLFGEKLPFSKLTEHEVEEIINLLENSDLSIEDISKKYCVCSRNISSINCGKSWKHKSTQYPIRKQDIREDAKKPIPNKLSTEDHIKILELSKQNKTQQEIAGIFNVCQTTISKVINKKVRSK